MFEILITLLQNFNSTNQQTHFSTLTQYLRGHARISTEMKEEKNIIKNFLAMYTQQK